MLQNRAYFYLLLHKKLLVLTGIVCESQSLRNGRISCTNGNYYNSVCSYECPGEDFELEPRHVTTAICTDNSQWNVSQPCCGSKLYVNRSLQKQ